MIIDNKKKKMNYNITYLINPGDCKFLETQIVGHGVKHKMSHFVLIIFVSLVNKQILLMLGMMEGSKPFCG